MRYVISISAVLVLAGLMACGTPPKPSPTPVDAAQATPAPSEREAELSDPQRQEWLKQDLATFAQDNPDLLNANQQEALERCEAQACMDLTAGERGVAFDEDKGPTRVPFWGKACMAGIGEACERLAQTYQAASLPGGSEDAAVHAGKREDLRRRFLYYMDRACRLEAPRCVHWADHALLVPESQERAAEKLKAACAEESAEACQYLAQHHKRGAGLPQDLTAARELFLRACKLGEAGRFEGACIEAGNMLLEGIGGPAKVEEGLALLEPRCAPGSAGWASECKGEPQPFGESCSFKWTITYGAKCLPLAERWLGGEDASKQPAAQRLYAAICAASPLPGEAKAMVLACQRSGAHLKASQASEPILQKWRETSCGQELEVCTEDVVANKKDFKACFEEKEACLKR